MRATPNLGRQRGRAFEAVYAELAERNQGLLLPFLLEGVAGRAALLQPDGIHPNAAGHERIAALLWPLLEPAL